MERQRVVLAETGHVQDPLAPTRRWNGYFGYLKKLIKF
jgi:hypothetical protein